MIGEDPSEVMCKPHGPPGKQRSGLRAQEELYPGGSILEIGKWSMCLDQGQRGKK